MATGTLRLTIRRGRFLGSRTLTATIAAELGEGRERR